MILVKCLADLYLLIGQFMLLTRSLVKNSEIWVKFWMDILIYFQLPVFTYERRMAIRVGKGTFNVSWIKDCKSVVELRNSDNDRQRRNSVYHMQSRLIVLLPAFRCIVQHRLPFNY